MFIAAQKKKENIAEYILYMWQLEDMLRACNLNADMLSEQLVDPLDVSEEQKHLARNWYANLAKQMKSAKIESKGHIYELVELISELFFLHTTVHTTLNNKEYNKAYADAQPLLQELMKKQPNMQNDVETALTFLYGIWMLKLKKQKLSPDTTSAVPAISKWLAHLSKMYHQMKAGKLDFTKN